MQKFNICDNIVTTLQLRIPFRRWHFQSVLLTRIQTFKESTRYGALKRYFDHLR
jgi:hypothetical protein